METTLLKYLFNVSLFWHEPVFYSVTVSNEQDTRNRSMSKEMGRVKIQSSETIKYSNSKLKRDVTSVEWIQCNPFSFLTDLSDMKLPLFSSSIRNVYLTWRVPSISLVFLTPYLGNGHLMLLKYMNISHVSRFECLFLILVVDFVENFNWHTCACVVTCSLYWKL